MEDIHAFPGSGSIKRIAKRMSDSRDEYASNRENDISSNPGISTNVRRVFVTSLGTQLLQGRVALA